MSVKEDNFYGEKMVYRCVEGRSDIRIYGSIEIELPLDMSFFYDYVVVCGGEGSLEFFEWRDSTNDRPAFEVFIEFQDLQQFYRVEYIPPLHLAVTLRSSSSRFFLFHLPTLKIVKNFNDIHTEPCWRVNHIPELSRSSMVITSSSGDNSIGVWRADGKNLYHLKGHSEYVRETISFRRNNRLYSCSQDGKVNTWDLRSSGYVSKELFNVRVSKVEGSLRGSRGLYSMDTNEELGVIIAGSSCEGVFIISPEEKNPYKGYARVKGGSIWDVIVNKEKQLFVAGCFQTKTYSVFDFRKYESPLFQQVIHTGTLYGLTQINNNLFATGSYNREMKIFPFVPTDEGDEEEIDRKFNILLKNKGSSVKNKYLVNYKRRRGPGTRIYGLTSFWKLESKKRMSAEALRDLEERTSFLLEEEGMSASGSHCFSMVIEESFRMDFPKIFLSL